MSEVNTMTEEYRRKEQEFMARHDSLCENVSPSLCNCSECPTRELCEWLDAQFSADFE